MATGPEQPKPPPGPENPSEQPSDGGAQTQQEAKERLAKLLRDSQQAIEQAKQELRQKKEIVDVSTKDTVTKTTREIAKIIHGIRDKKVGDKYDFLPSVTREILESINPHELEGKALPLLATLINESLANNLEQASSLMSLASKLYDLRDIDPSTARKIFCVLVEKMRAKGVTGEILAKIDGFLAETAVEGSRQRITEFDGKRNAVRRKIISFPIESKLRPNIERQLRQQFADALENRSMSEEELSRRIDNEATTQADRLRGGIHAAYITMLGAPDLNTRLERAEAFMVQLRELANKGLLDSTEITDIRKEIDEILNLFQKSDADVAEMARRGGLEAQAGGAGIPLSDRQAEILRAFDGGNVALRGLLRKYRIGEDGRPDPHGRIDFDKFTQDIRSIFEETMSIIDNRPHEFFDQAFSPISYQAQFFNTLQLKLISLGREIAGDPELSGDEVEVTEVDFLPDDNAQLEVGMPKQRMAHFKKKNINLAEAMGEYLSNKMIKLRSITEYLHNTEVISYQGLGFEQLAKYSETLSTEDIDRLFYEDQELTDVYNLFIRNLMDEVAMNAHVVISDFGHTDSTNLNFIQRRAYYQMLSRKGVPTGNGEEKYAMDRMLKRKVRMASGISMGATGEFWGLLLTSRMPLSYEPYKVPNPKYDPKHPGKEPEKITKYRVKTLYTGAQHGGYEKMIGTLDLDLALQRFGNPFILPVIRYVYQPRDPKKYAGAYRDAYNHTEVYRVRDEVEDAYVSGRSDYLANFDENNVILSEWLKGNTIDLFYRGGWRFLECRTFLRYKNKEATVLDFERSINNLKKIGLFAVKYFIDNLADVKSLDAEDINKVLGIRVAGANLSDDQKRAFKLTCYERFIFDRIKKLYPSKFISLERRRYTPKGESFIQDDVVARLKEVFPSLRPEFVEEKLLKLFTSSVELAEKMYWKDPGYDQQDKLLDREGELDESILESEPIKTSLLRFFDYYKRDTGIIQSGDDRLSMREMTNEQYLNGLKEFFKALKESINKERWIRQDKKTRETISQRYAKLLSGPIGGLEFDISGDDFDFSNFLIEQGGKRVFARMLGETQSVEGKMNPGFVKLINESLPAFVKGHYPSNKELEQAITELFAKVIKEIASPVSAYGGKDAYQETVYRLMVFMDRLVSKDRMFRIVGVGGAWQDFVRRKWGTQATLMSDYFRKFYSRDVTELNSDQSYLLGKAIANYCDLPWKQEQVTSYQDVGGLGKLLGLRKPVYNEGASSGFKWNFDLFKKVAGHTNGANTVEKFIPIGTLVLFLIIMQMMRQANEANKKK